MQMTLICDNREAGMLHLSGFLPRLDPYVAPEAPIDHPLHPAAQQENSCHAFVWFGLPA